MTDADAPLDWTDEGAPRSRLYDDIYFQPGEGLAETRAVFLAGCGLPDAWQGRASFVVGELGFGTGLNILALLQLWRDTRQPGQRLNIFSIEAHPLARADAERALRACGEGDALAERLVQAWPRQAAGFHRLDFPEIAVALDVGIGEAAAMLQAWDGRADAWFLDGFAPAKNPQMWRDEVLSLVAKRSAPGARVATFTVAGAVRRGLAEAGFTVERLPGHGRKRQRLEARLPGARDKDADPAGVAVVGGGIAAACLMRALEALGLPTTQIAVPGQIGASGNPAALVTPGLDAGEGPGGRLYAQALARAVDLYATVPGAIIAQGVLQLEREPRDARRFDRIADSGLFPPGTMRRLSSEAMAQRLGERPAAGGLDMSEALTVCPAAILTAWASGAPVAGVAAEVAPCGDGWKILDARGGLLAEAGTVILAAGAGLGALTGLPLGVVRGQATWANGVQPGPAAAWGGYAAPLADGVLFGATHDRGDWGLDTREGDDQRNLAALAKGRPGLARRLSDAALMSRAGLRATAPDRLPVAGALPGMDGVFVLGALGSRGFTTAPLLAEHIAAMIAMSPSPLPCDLASAVAPGRLLKKSATADPGPDPGRI